MTPSEREELVRDINRIGGFTDRPAYAISLLAKSILYSAEILAKAISGEK